MPNQYGEFLDMILGRTPPQDREAMARAQLLDAQRQNLGRVDPDVQARADLYRAQLDDLNYPGMREAKLRAQEALGGQREASAYNQTSLGDTRYARTPAQIQSDFARAHQADAAAGLTTARTATEDALRDPTVANMLSKTLGQDVTSGLHRIQGEHIQAMEPFQQEQMKAAAANAMANANATNTLLPDRQNLIQNQAGNLQSQASERNALVEAKRKLAESQAYKNYLPPPPRIPVPNGMDITDYKTLDDKKYELEKAIQNAGMFTDKGALQKQLDDVKGQMQKIRAPFVRLPSEPSTGATTSTVAPPRPSETTATPNRDQEALAWANAHPDDPRAAAIRAKAQRALTGAR